MPNYRRVNHRTFVNPYNFVKLGRDCIKNIDYLTAKETSDAITGWLDCELELKSPVFIPNSSNNKFFGRWHQEQNGELKSYEFFSYDDLTNTQGDLQTPPPSNPVIPGSEIRGMIRSAYEALTNSCLSTIDPEMSFHKRAPKSSGSGKPGLLRKNGTGWEIQPCIRYMIKTGTCPKDAFVIPVPRADWIPKLRARERTGANVIFGNSIPYHKAINGHVIVIGDTVQDDPLTYTAPAAQVGKVHVTAGFLRKHHDSVFVIDSGKPPISISREEAENYLENLKVYLAHDKFGPDYTHLNKGDNIDNYDNVCVYYTEYGRGLTYISPSMINREMLYKKLGDRIGSYKPCDDTKHLCSACSLFGMVSGKSSVSSRFRFSDALPVNESPEFRDPVLLEELAGPKPGASEFYLERPTGQANWNYDYQMNWGAGNNAAVTDYTGRIRGRKFYWHQASIKTSPLLNQHHLTEEQKKKLLRMSLVRPLSKGTFRFKVCFDRVSRADVYKLIYTMTIGFSGEHAHKIGMGKPLGLGSVQIKVNQISRRGFDDSGTRKEYNSDLNSQDSRAIIIRESEKRLATNGVLSQFKELTKIEHAYDIRYPYITSNGNIVSKSFKWFVGNRQMDRIGRANNPRIDQVLNEPASPEQVVIEEY